MGLLLVMPVFSTGIPVMARAGLSFFTALLSTPIVVAMNILPPVPGIAEYGIVLLSSVLVGLAIGFIVQVTVSTAQYASNIFSISMGLSFSESVNPLTTENTPALGNLLSVMILLLFIRTESHITYIELIVDSFMQIPIIHMPSLDNMFIALKTATAIIFSIAFRLSIPIISVTMMLDMGMGLIARVAPQFNVMVMGWNIKILIGFIMLWFIMPGVMDFGSVIFRELYNSVVVLIRHVRG